ncbi:hypothetical protein FSARC_1635 [Fusarium sarcochroum]|uniref:DUF6546 domain-containing protein n=1 Tax=Fusarium sarcochroum TaxID=1208366 RepID=A0A8H4XEW6_9HYPO|nr:hypothetical protein FSARC_1635 [Fusarium sarcochroum]
MYHFNSLPPELRTKTLNLVAQSSDIAVYASVDKHWQSFFEAKTFKGLILDQNDLDDLERIVISNRRQFVKHIWLRIELVATIDMPYQRSCSRYVPWAEDRTFTLSICHLWDILSKWETPSEKSSQGLTLELSAEEPRRWRSKLFGSRPLSFGYSIHHDISYIRNYEVPQLPHLPVVTKFLILRSQFREINATALDSMIQSLPCVENINIERWRSPVSGREQDWCRDAKVPFGMSLPLSVKTLSLYGETSHIFHSWPAKSINTVALAKSLRQYGKHLENLSVSHLIDAKDFFGTFWPTHSDRIMGLLPEWDNLKTLSLTSEILTTNIKVGINNLLCAAARAVRKMPNLQLLELWNEKEMQACVFRYRVAATVSEITWLGTHVDTLDSQVVEAWNETSVAHGRRGLRASAHKLEYGGIISAGTILRYLDLKSQIMHSVSGYRAAWEQSSRQTLGTVPVY